jgi:V8-like Glu-specific endopeptidase
MKTFRFVVLMVTVACVVSFGFGAEDRAKPDAPSAVQAVPSNASSLPPLSARIPTVEIQPLDAAVLPSVAAVEEAELRPNHPPFDQIPPAPMPWPSDEKALGGPGAPVFHDAVTGATVVLPVAGQQGVAADDAPKQLAGFEGVYSGLGIDKGTRTFWDMYKINNTADHPWRMNAKLVMRFRDQANNDRWFGCSGSMIDAETVLCAGHCVYLREVDGPDIFNWAEEIWVYPGKDGADEPFGYGHGTYFGAFTGWTNNGDFDWDAGMIRITRAVGVLTGWYGKAWDGGCGWIQDHTYHNASYPGEDCPPPGGLHNGEDMYYWYGIFDSCPGNQLQIDTGGGHCFDTVWGGMSGSGAYYIDGDSRYVHAVCSNSDRMWVGRYCKLWGSFADYMNNTFIPGSRGSTFDLQALDANATPASVPAGSALSSADFLATNPTNGSANGTWTVRSYLSTNNDISSSDTLLGTGSFNWNFGAMSSVRVNLGSPTIPVSTVPGNYWFGVILDPATDGDSSNNDTDGWDAAPLTVTFPIPANDDCGDATVIPASASVNYNPAILNTVSATSVTSDPYQNCTYGGPNKNSNTVWYRFTPPCAGVANINTCGSSYDTVLSVHTGSCGSLTEIACSDDGCGYQSSISNLALTGGQTIYIDVSDYNLPGGGNLDFHFDFVGTPPANDDCADARLIAVPSSTVGSTACATGDGAPFCQTAQAAPGVWYRVYGTGNTMTASTCNEFSTYNTKISVYCNGCDTLSCVAGNDNNCTAYSGLLSKVSWCSQYGTTYLILVHGDHLATGGFILDVYDDGNACTGAVECGGHPIGACCAPYACDQGEPCSTGINWCDGRFDCYCFQTSDGGSNCASDFVCSVQTPCPNGTSDCPAGEICYVNTCCGAPICGPGSCAPTSAEVQDEIRVGAVADGELTASGSPLTGEVAAAAQCLEIDQNYCELRGGLYQGDGVDCDETVCPGPTGACCLAGQCIGNYEEPQCREMGGTWYRGENCETFVCPAFGACCAPWTCSEGFVCGSGRFPVCNGSFGPCFCFTTAEGELTCLDGSQACGQACPNGTSDCPTGYACVVNTCCGGPVCALDGCGGAAAAEAQEYSGPTLAGNVPFERLAIAGGGYPGCRELEPLACEAYVGLYQGDSTLCAGADCPGPPQACCLPDGHCVEVDHAACVAHGGDPQGPGTSCANRRCNAIKWAQPPILNENPQYPECFWGWDEPSVYGAQWIVADDWPCMTDRPVSDIHWWGSYLNWDSPVPPTSGGPVAFHIGIWTNERPTIEIPFSHPGKMVWDWNVERRTLNERAVGCDFFPEHSIDACFRYDFRIRDEREWFKQGPSCEIFWVSISAIYEGIPSRNPWGWKTRKHVFEDAAVRIFEPTAPIVGARFGAGEPIVTGREPFFIPWDMAFVLTTVLPNEACCLPDGVCVNQPANECVFDGGVPQGPGTVCTQPQACCLEDGSCKMVDPLCCDELGGVVQATGVACSAPQACCLPDGTCAMLDPLCCSMVEGVPMGPNSRCSEPQGCCMQDGGECRNLDPLCCQIFGGIPQGPGELCSERMTACCMRDGSCKMLDPLCCDDMGGTPSPIGARDCMGDLNGNGVDDACEVPLQACCLRDGQCVDTDHRDCVGLGGDPQGPGTRCSDTVCYPLKWAQPPVLNPESPRPDCFWGWDEYSVYGSQQQIVADDWLCDSDMPVADIHWWGSYYRWTAPEPPSVGPEAFHIGIWKDVPSGTTFSHPGDMVWELVVDRRMLRERMVGCDFYPDRPQDACFRYDLQIPREKWFYQGPQCEIYWISIAAIYPESPLPTRNPWGWKTRPHMFKDAAVRIFDPTAPTMPARFREGAPILTGDIAPIPWDMAFVLTTAKTEACCLHDQRCMDVPREVCVEMQGKPQGPGTVCTEPAACCLDDGTCIEVDPLCCDEFGGIPQQPGTHCTIEEACCLPDGSCKMLDPLCCREMGGRAQGPDTRCSEPQGCCLRDGTCREIDPLCCDEFGGVPQGPDGHCTQPEACCLSDGTCRDMDPLCCDDFDGRAQGPGTACVNRVVACCLPDGTCKELDPLCCDDMGGVPSPIGSPVCLGDSDGNGVDDACEVRIPACCLRDGSCVHLGHMECVERGGDPQGPGTSCEDRICNRIKWAQPPLHGPQQPGQPNCFFGWDEPSVYGGHHIVADDWLCDSNKPVTDVHWWGSYVGWIETVPPVDGPQAFRIGVWTDVPANVDQPFSHPGTMIWEWVFDRSMVSERPVGCDFFPDHPMDTCFRYDLVLPESLWFYQGPQCEIYWVSIAAIHGLCPCNPDMNCDGTVDENDAEPFELALTDPDEYHNRYPDCDIRQADVNCDGRIDDEDRRGFYCLLEGGAIEDCCPTVPEFVWGWKTRKHFFNDDAVRIFVPSAPGVGDRYQQGLPIMDPSGVSWDMAFVLTTDCPRATIVDSRPPNGVLDARQPHAHNAALPRQGIGSPGMLGSQREPITVLLNPPVRHAEECFELCETKVDPLLGPNSIASVVDLGGGKYEMVLDHAIMAGGVTTIQYLGDGSFVEFTSHPANVDADTASSPVDILKIIDILNGVMLPPWGNYSCDVDRSNLCAPADILRVIDLLNGADAFDPWLGIRRPVNTSCP